ncbi:MAG: phosphomannomutase/phosphoglucomutase, partial [Gammaproteobacteria bacterium]
MTKSSINVGAARARLAALPRHLLGAAALVVVLAVGAVLLFGTPDGGGNGSGGWSASYRALARQVAARVEAVLLPYRDAARAIAADDRVADALRADDVPRLAALAAALAPTLDGMLALRLLPAAVRDAALDASPPLTYASISLMRRARESGEMPRVEAHLAGTDDEHVVLIEAVAPEGGPLLGFVHLSLDPDVVRDALRNTPVPGAYAEIRQGAKVRLASSGNAPAAEAPALTEQVPGTAFAVRLAAPGAAVPQPGDGFPPLLVLAAALVALALVAAAVLVRRRGSLVTAAGDDSTVLYAGAIKAILDGAHPGLEQLLPRARAGRPARTDFELGSLPRAAAEDVTTLEPAPLAADDPTIPKPPVIRPDAAGIIVTETSAAEAVPASVFRSYDIRGIVGETLTEEGVYQIGRALGAEAEARGQKTVVVARDGRHSSEPFLQALSKGLIESGRDVLDIGLAPTPVLYFATHYLDARSGVMITGSHNPASYNGLKIVLDGNTLCGEAIQAIRRRVDEQDFIDGTGSLQSADIIAEYIRRISEEIPVTLGNALRVVVDCGNAVPGAVAPDVLRAIGHDVIELYCDVDGDFPNHHPDPSQPENLQALIDAVQEEGADLGLAFDGDGDRLGVVDAEGNVIWPD